MSYIYNNKSKRIFMKKVITLLAIVALVSCGEASSSSEEIIDSVAVSVDSTTTDSVEISEPVDSVGVVTGSDVEKLNEK
jgi:hypothetical protein